MLSLLIKCSGFNHDMQNEVGMCLLFNMDT